MKPTFVLSLLLPCIALLSACSKPGPVVLSAEVIANPSGRAPLTAVCRLTTQEPSIPKLTVNNGKETFEVPVGDEYKTEHEVNILGLRPGTANRITVAARGENGGETVAGEETITTAALPENFPPIEVRISEPAKMEPGYTFIPFMSWPKGTLNANWGLVVALGSAGEIVWYMPLEQTLDEPRLLANGNMVFSRGREGYLYEIDMMGNIVRQWHSTGIPKEAPDGSIPVETDTFHHDFTIMPSGNFLILSTEARFYENYPLSEEDPTKTGPSNVIGDVIIEITPDGKIVRELKLLDILDPYRLAYDSLQTFFWVGIYQKKLDKPGIDWSHVNSIEYDPRDDCAIISVYHQDCVVKLDLDSGEIKWILGDHGNWKEPWQKYLLTPKGDFEWSYHQHSAKLTPDGNLILYDNGLYRALPPKAKMAAADSHSRAVEFKIDEQAMTIEQVWQYGNREGERFFAPFISEVDWLPETGNILVTNGGLVKDKDGNQSDQILGGHHWSTIVEVTHTTPAEKVFEVVIDDTPPDGWAVYRSQRLPSLYPQSK